MKKIKIVAFVGGKEVASTGDYGLNATIADECLDITNDLARLLLEMYTEEAEIMSREDYNI